MDIRETLTYVFQYFRNNKVQVDVKNQEEVTKPIVSELSKIRETLQQAERTDEELINLPIVTAIKESEVSVVKAIREKEGVSEVKVLNLPEFGVDLSSVTELLKKISEKEVVVTEKNVDFAPVLKALKALEKSLAESKDEKDDSEEIDYSEYLKKIIEVIEKPQDNSEILQALKEISSKEELSSVSQWLKTIAEKEEPAFNFTDGGRLKVSVDRVGMGGGGGTGVTNTDGTAINPAVEEKQDPTAAYSISEIDESGTTKYYGYLNATGWWYIMEVTGTTVRYAIGTTSFSTNWTNRAGLTYETFDNVF